MWSLGFTRFLNIILCFHPRYTSACGPAVLQHALDVQSEEAPLMIFSPLAGE